MAVGFLGGLRGLWGFDGAAAALLRGGREAEVGREVDAEEVAEGAQGAAEGCQGLGWDWGEEGGGLGGVEEVAELAAVAGGAVADLADQPKVVVWAVRDSCRGGG